MTKSGHGKYAKEGVKMTKSGHGKYALMAAICYAVYGAYDIINSIVYAVQDPDYASITILNIISWLPTIGMAVTLFLKNEKAVIAATGIYALFNAYLVIGYFSLWNAYGLILYFNYSLWTLFYFLSYVALAVILVLALKGNTAVKKIWFIAAEAMLLGCLIFWFQNECFSYISSAWKSMLFSIVEIVALVFVGLWLKENITPAQVAHVNEYATFNPQAVYSSPATSSAIGGADKLKMYKDLLDSGTITQDEFDAKKKQILGS